MEYACAASVFVAAVGAQAQTIVLASTTSTEQSGLFAHLLPAFKQASGIDVKVVALGTGQALDMGRRGDADVLLVHDPEAEESMVADGFAIKRWPVMHNDFVLVGPRTDPAQARGNSITHAFKQLAARGASFVSRGDKSGTHAAELRFWKLARLSFTAGPPQGEAAPSGGSDPRSGGAWGPGHGGGAKGSGYRECGCGMGPALNMASSLGAYLLTDRGTWLSFKNRGDLALLVEGDTRLFNPYGVLRVNPAKHPHTRAAEGQKFIDWLVSAPGQAAIGAYMVGGEPLFFPHAGGAGR